VNETQLKKAPEEDVLFYVKKGPDIFVQDLRRMEEIFSEILSVPAEIQIVCFYITSHKCQRCNQLARSYRYEHFCGVEQNIRLMAVGFCDCERIF